MVHAGIEVDVFEQKLGQRRTFQILRDAAVTAPVVGNCAASMRNDKFQGGKIPENVESEELHEGGRVAIEEMRAGGVEIGVAGSADVDHRRHIELDHLFVERVPEAIGERGITPVST